MPPESAIVVTGAGPLSVNHAEGQIIAQSKRNRTDGCLLCSGVVSEVPDRTYALKSPDDHTNPKTCAEAMFRGIKHGVYGFINAYPKVEKIAAVIACNTFHVREIFSEYLELISKLQQDVRDRVAIEVINMPEATANFLANQLLNTEAPDKKKVGILCTSGSREFGLYDKIFELLGWKSVNLPPEMQAKLHNAIYNEILGLKVNPNSTEASEIVWECIVYLLRQGVRAIVLGCTELRFGTQKSWWNDDGVLKTVWDMFVHGSLPKIALEGHAPDDSAFLLDSTVLAVRKAIDIVAPKRLINLDLSVAPVIVNKIWDK